MGKNHKKRDKSQKRCIISNKLINGGDEDVVMTDYAVEYVKQLGYAVIPIRVEHTIKVLAVIFSVVGVVGVSLGVIL